MAAASVTINITKSAILLGAVVVQVQVHSLMRPGLKANNEMQFDRYATDRDMKAFVMTAAGAEAEYLNEKYKDSLDPSECAKVAEEVLKKIVDDLMSGKGLTSHTITS